MRGDAAPRRQRDRRLGRLVRRIRRQGGPWADLLLPRLAPRERVQPVIPPPRLRRVRVDPAVERVVGRPRVRRVPDQDPVLWDEACTMGLNPGCDVQAAARRLREDEDHFGLGGLLLPHPQPWRAASEGFRENERAWQAEQERRRDPARGSRSPWEHAGGFVKGVVDWGAGAWDGVARGYESTSLVTCSPALGGCDVHQLPGVSRDEHARATRENAAAAGFVVEHPKEAGKALINWEDLSEGRYGEWLGTLAPDLAIALATGGAGSVSKLAAARRALDAPTPPRRRRGRIDDAPGSRAVLEELLGHTSSLRTSPRPGFVVPTRVRGGASELRALYDWGARSYVRRVTPVAHRPGGRSPDFVVTLRDGRRVRVEVTTVSEGAGSGYRRRGFGRSGPVTRSRITGAIDRKVKPARTQFNAPLGDVPQGGILSLHLRGPAAPAATAADDAIAARRTALEAAGVRTVEVNLTDRRVIRYTRTPSGEWRRRGLAGR